jgi:hypothetical protein
MSFHLSLSNRMPLRWHALAARRRVMTGSAASVRLVILLLGTATVLLPAHPVPVPALATGIGTVLATYSPARAGATLAVLGGIGGWLGSYGLHASPPAGRVLIFAVVLYLLHSSTALAGAVPISATLDLRTVLRWGARCLLHLAIAGVLLLLGYLLKSPLGHADSRLLNASAVLGVAAILATMVWLFSRSPR